MLQNRLVWLRHAELHEFWTSYGWISPKKINSGEAGVLEVDLRALVQEVTPRYAHFQLSNLAVHHRQVKSVQRVQRVWVEREVLQTDLEPSHRQNPRQTSNGIAMNSEEVLQNNIFAFPLAQNKKKTIPFQAYSLYRFTNGQKWTPNKRNCNIYHHILIERGVWRRVVSLCDYHPHTKKH